MDEFNIEVAIYCPTDRASDVPRALPVPFSVERFPFEDLPSGPTTSVLRYRGHSGEWTDECTRTAIRLGQERVIQRFGVGRTPRR